MLNKISLALILKRKSCICCQKHCIAYFRRHMECAVLKRFLKVQGTFSIKKFLQIPLSIWKKLNLIRFIKALIKGFTLFSPHPSLRDTFPKWKALKASQMDFRKTQCNCVLIKVLLNFFQKIFRVWGETPRSFSPINFNYISL